MGEALSNIGTLIAGVLSLYGELHPALRRLFAISFAGWAIIFPAFLVLRRLFRGSY